MMARAAAPGPVACLVLLVALALSGPARAQYLIADLSEHKISITSGFTGAEVLLFGTRDGEGDVIVVLRGPQQPLVVRRKARTVGLWLNRDQVIFAGAPGYYAVAASRPLAEIAPPALLEEHEIGFRNLRLSPSYTGVHPELEAFGEALLRNMERPGLYRAETGEVVFVGKQLFRTTFAFPANVPTGLFHADIFLVEDGVLVSKRSTALEISKSGFEAAMFQFAKHRPLAYGLVAVVVALMAGWVGGVIFRKT
jgi:uncharacterized protein (TIGR02186 family)